MDHVTYYVRFYLRIEIKYCFHFLKESHMTSSLHLSTYFKELGKNQTVIKYLPLVECPWFICIVLVIHIFRILQF